MKHDIISSGIDKLSNKAWIEVEFSNFETNEKSMLFAGCTRNYLDDHFEGSIQKFLDFIVNKWAPKMDIVFNKEVHIDPYADSEEGLKNVIDFLTRASKND